MEPMIFCARATRGLGDPRWMRAMEDPSAPIPQERTSELGRNMYIVRCAQESGGFVGWKGFVGFCLLLLLLEFTDALISFGELEHDFVKCDSMLLIPLRQLYV